MQYDLIIRDGMIVDGSGMARYRADVGIAGGRIATIQSFDEKAELVGTPARNAAQSGADSILIGEGGSMLRRARNTNSPRAHNSLCAPLSRSTGPSSLRQLFLRVCAGQRLRVREART